MRRLAAAFACFGVALCVKQHFVMAPLISLFLLVWNRARCRLGLVSIVRYVLIALTIVVLYYSMEEWVTEGRMSRSILVAAGNVGVGPSCGLGLRRQSLAGSHLEVRGFDPLAGGCRSGHGIDDGRAWDGGHSLRRAQFSSV